MKKYLALILAVLCIASFAACTAQEEDLYKLGNADRARIFYNKYNELVEKYGEPAVAETADGSKVLSGVAVARLMDFTGDGVDEIIFAYSTQKGGAVDHIIVYGFEYGLACIYDKELTSKASAQAKGNSLWLFTDVNERSYIVTGEDLSARGDYETFVKEDEDGNKLYAFHSAFYTTGKTSYSGTYEKIDIVDNDHTQAIFDETAKVVRSCEKEKN